MAVNGKQDRWDVIDWQLKIGGPGIVRRTLTISPYLLSVQSSLFYSSRLIYNFPFRQYFKLLSRPCSTPPLSFDISPICFLSCLPFLSLPSRHFCSIPALVLPSQCHPVVVKELKPLCYPRQNYRRLQATDRQDITIISSTLLPPLEAGPGEVVFTRGFKFSGLLNIFLREWPVAGI